MPVDPRAAHDLPLIGRERELAVLRSSHASGWVIIGEPGVGKSRLARECRKWAEEKGWATLWLTASEQLQAVPFGAMVRLLTGQSAEQHSFIAAEQYLRAQVQHAPGGRLLLVVDDGHWLDRWSQATVQHLVSVPGVSVLVTARAKDGGTRWLVPIWKESFVERLDLQALSREQARCLVELELGGPVDDLLDEALWRVTQGNPLYLREVVISASHGGVVTFESGMWCAAQGLQFTGERLHDAVAVRLGDLSAQEQLVVDVLAVCGPLSIAVLQGLTSETCVSALEQRGIVQVSAHSLRASLAHPLYGEVRRADMPTTRRRSVLRTFADAVAGADDDEASLIPLAQAKLELGREDPELFLSAAVALRHRVELAIRLSLGAGGREGSSAAQDEDTTRHVLLRDPQRLVLTLAMASVHGHDGIQAGILALLTASELGDWTAVDEALTALDQVADDDMSRAEVASHRAMALLYRHGDRTAAEQVLDRALAGIEDPAAIRVTHLNRLRVSAMATADRDVAERAVQLLSDRELETPHQGEALAILAMVLGMQGRASPSLDSADKAISVLGTLPPGAAPMGTVDVLVNQLFTYLFAGRLNELTDLLQQLEAASAASSHRTELQLAHGEGDLFRGALKEAQRAFGSAVAMLRRGDQFNIRAWPCASLAYARMHSGDLAGADEALLAMHDSPRLYAWMQPFVVRATAWRAGIDGNGPLARRTLVDAARRELAAGRLAGAVLLLHDTARLSYFRDAARWLATVASAGYQAPWLPAMIDFASGASESDPRALEAAATKFEELGCRLWAAEAFTLASAAHRRGGLAGRAHGAATRAARIAAELDSPTTPILNQACEPHVLSRREAEIARLAAAGLTDREIASRLVVSVRTVQSHLYSVYAKLGVRGRRDLQPLLAPQAGQITPEASLV